MRTEIVLFTQRVEIVEAYNERRDCADQRISEFINACGYIPVPVPNNRLIAVSLAERLKPMAIILTGGNSLVKYGGNSPERDETDKALIEFAIGNCLPLYGFCRGMQSILDYFGNELVNVEGHVAVRHDIKGIENTVSVNSYHRQACLSISSDALYGVMRAEDGVIEKIRHKSLPIMGTMWHPERENPFREEDIRAFIILIEGAKKC